MANSIKNVFTEEGVSRVANKITKVLEDSGFQTDKDLARHILLMLAIGSYKVSAVKRDLTNEQMGEIIINELNNSMKANFGDHTTAEIIKSIFIGIAKYDMMS
jgi:hypothetical protein